MSIGMCECLLMSLCMLVMCSYMFQCVCACTHVCVHFSKEGNGRPFDQQSTRAPGEKQGI